MSEPMFESDADVEAALSDAVAQDAAYDAEQQAAHNAPSAPPQGENVDAPVQPDSGPVDQAEAEPSSPEQDTFDGGKFNPDELPPELLDGWKQLQAAYTRKTQEIAQQRQALEQFGDLNAVQQAVQAAQLMRDPRYWPVIYEQLSNSMAQMGMLPDPYAGWEQEGEFVDPATLDDPDLAAELAPFRNDLTSMRSELEQLRAEREYERQQAGLERQYMSIVGELTRQENAIRAANPKYSDNDLDHIYELASFHNGDLFKAQETYEGIRARTIESYFAEKQAATERAAVQPPPVSAPSATPVEKSDKTLEDAAVEAEEELRALIAAGEVEF